MKNFYLSAPVLFTLACTFNAFATPSESITVSLPDPLTIESIDGTPLVTPVHSVHLSNENQQLQLRYIDRFEDNADTAHPLQKSAALYIDIPSLLKKLTTPLPQNIVVSMPSINNAEQAKQYLASPSVTINTTSKKLNIKLLTLNQYLLSITNKYKK
ncbi:DUF2057 family protein [Shewanella intestini]|uniref:DUF2057 domain-containing protein n=1 Tax=Shewanella intestini TaxID=2017544 RepID=A0ABS5I4L4_9GAMM|nr:MULTISPECIES: DUF2057 family protein [Shewanella]MBR9728305.1 DUF2057 domain-containing protein [Shewanella intestini]MRG35770.1 DUF2057 domain-containing protein [Shewanella sp. XMDDZSB0408]